MAIAATTKVSIRLLNSMALWMPSARCGTNERPLQRGQVGQPRPEPVSRTTPPVTTMPMFATSEAIAAGRIQVRTQAGGGVRVGGRGWASVVPTAFTLPGGGTAGGVGRVCCVPLREALEAGVEGDVR